MANNRHKESLNSLGIYELRTIARQLGVYSPTLLKKDELIQKIVNITNGVEQPHIRTTKQGRPAKNITHLSNIVSMLNEMPYAERFNKDNMALSGFNHNLSYTEINGERFEGIINILDEEGLIKCSMDKVLTRCVKVSDVLIDKFALKTGDYVTGEGFLTGNSIIAREIDSINGLCTEKPVVRENFDELSREYPHNQIMLSKLNNSLINFSVIDKIFPIAEGARVVVNYEDDYADLNDLDALLKLPSLNYDVFILTTTDMPEDIERIKCNYENINIITIDDSISLQENFDNIKVKLQYIYRLVEQNHNVVLLVNNYSNMLENASNNEVLTANVNCEQAKIIAKTKLLKLFNSAKATKQNGSLTIYMTNCKDEQFLNVCNVKLLIKSKPYASTDITVDLINSKIKHLDKIFNEKDFKNVNEFNANILQGCDIVENLNKLFEK